VSGLVQRPLGLNRHLNRHALATVIPAQAGISGRHHQIPACAGMTPD
jgi:hypothetical protein